MINMTPAAVKAVQRFIRGSETPVAGLRLVIAGGGCSGLQYSMKLEAEKAELLKALKQLRGVEVWVQDREMKEHFQKTVYTAIKNAEKKEQ